jgi:uncharacterized protein YraI
MLLRDAGVQGCRCAMLPSERARPARPSGRGAPAPAYGGEALNRLTDGARAAPSRSAATPKRRPRAARLALLAIIPALALAAASPWPAGADAVATVIPPEGLFLRAAPGTQYQSLDLAPGGTKVALVGPENAAGWYPTVYKGKRGWMRGEFLDTGGDAAAMTRRATVRTSEGTSLQAEPHAAAVRLATVAQSAAVTVSARTTTDGWVLVAHAGLSGWVVVEHLVIEGAPPPAPLGSTLGTPAPLVSPVVPGTAVNATITYYHPSLEGGGLACGGRYRAEDPTIAAATSWPCGTRLKVCRSAACIVVTVQDSGHMGPNWVDLSSAAFRQLAPLADMLVTGTVEVLPPGP